MEMAPKKVLAIIQEAVAADHKGSVSEDDGIPKVIRSDPVLFNENTDSILLVVALLCVVAPGLYL